MEKSLKGTLKLYGRAVDVLRQKRERELLTEALCDMGDLHVRKQEILAFVIQWFTLVSVAGGCQSLGGRYFGNILKIVSSLWCQSRQLPTVLSFVDFICVSLGHHEVQRCGNLSEYKTMHSATGLHT